jgi:hypothetical protein
LRSALVALAFVGCAKHESASPPTEDAWSSSADDEISASAGYGRADKSRAAPSPPAPPPPPPPPMVVAEAPPAEPEPAPSPAPEAPVKAEKRMVHYAGYARLRVTRVQESLDAIAAVAIGRGGRVEALTSTSIVVRVPVEDFAAAWAEIRQTGDVLDESVTAEDVTEAFFAMDLRVKTLTVTRDRLVALLAKAETEDEKISLLREIQRVTEALDQFERQLRTLRGLADYSRISVNLVPREAVGAGDSGPHVSGFGWIEALSPFNRSVGADERRAALPVPDGMVALSPKGQFVAESPEGAALWTGRVPNDPQAEAGFWIDAVVARLSDDFATATRTERGAWSCVTLVDASEEPYTWEVCAQADPADKNLVLAQAWYPDAEAVTRYAAAVAVALAGGGS